MIDFSVNTNPFGPPESILGYLEKGQSDASVYPELGAGSLVEAVTAWHDVGPGNVIVGNGSAELLYWLMAYLKPEKVLIEEPSFSDYRAAAEANGAEVSAVELSEDAGFASDWDRLDALAGQVDLVILGRPNNPTGQMSEHERLLALVQANQRTTFLIDEAFIDLVFPAWESVVQAAVTEKNMICLRSLTKTHSIPAIRLGYMVSDRGFIHNAAAARPPWPLGRAQIEIGRLALEEGEYVLGSARALSELRVDLQSNVDSRPWLRPVASDANYFLVEIRAGGPAGPDLQRALAERGVIIRSCATWRNLGDRYFRTAVRTGPENQVLVEALKSLEGELQ